MRKRIQSLLSGGFELDLFLGLFLKGGGAAASLAVNLIVSRTLGPDGVGIYQIALSTAVLLAILSTFGLDTIVLRSVAVAYRGGDLGSANVAIKRALRFNLLIGIPVALLMASAAWPLSYLVMGRPALLPSLVAMAVAVPCLGLIRTMAGSLRGTGSTLLAQSFDGVSYTGLTAAVLALMLLVSGTFSINAPSLIYAGGTLLVAVLGWLRLRAIRRDWPASGTQTLSLKAGARIATIYLSSVFCDWLAVVTLGAWHGTGEAGIYRVAVQFGMLFILVRNSFDQMIGPHLATAYGEGRFRQMLSITRKTGFIGGGVCLPLLLLILAAPSWLMALFGPDFVRGAPALVILAIGQFVSVAVGPIGTVLEMAHREKVTMHVELGVSALTLVLFVVLIPLYGLTGAASAVTLAIIARAAALTVCVRRFLAFARNEEAVAAAQ